MTNFKKTELGTIESIANFENGKVFLHDALELTGSEISVNAVPAGFKLPFNHKHFQNEEVYIILKGEGIITADGVKIPVKEGTAVKIAPDASRTFENTGDGILEFICLQTKANSLEQYGLSDAELC